MILNYSKFSDKKFDWLDKDYVFLSGDYNFSRIEVYKFFMNDAENCFLKWEERQFRNFWENTNRGYRLNRKFLE